MQGMYVSDFCNFQLRKKRAKLMKWKSMMTQSEQTPLLTKRKKQVVLIVSVCNGRWLSAPFCWSAFCVQNILFMLRVACSITI